MNYEGIHSNLSCLSKAVVRLPLCVQSFEHDIITNILLEDRYMTFGSVTPCLWPLL